MLGTRQLAPKKRTDRPEWEVTVDGKVIGWLKQKKLPNSSTIFYEAVALHSNGRSYSLELSADFDERAETLRQFHENPAAFNHHLPPEARV